MGLARARALLEIDVEGDAGAGADGAAVLDASGVEEAGEVDGAAQHGGEIFAESFGKFALLQGAEEVADGGGAGVFGLFDDDVGHGSEEVFAGAELGGGFELGGVESAGDEGGA